MTTALPRISIAIAHQQGTPELTLCDVGICLVLQGAKHLVVGDKTLRQSEGSLFASLVELPATRCLFETENHAPYVAVGLTLDHEVLGALLADIPMAPARDPVPGFSLADGSRELIEAWDHYLALFDAPSDVAALAAPRERELLYRLLQSPLGPLLRQFAHDEGRLSQIRRVITWMRSHFDEPLPIKTLADIAGMSVPAFNRHFKIATSASPLQYQKALRLQAARLLLARDNDVSRTAYAVGYGSASQFSREYARHFGRPPKQDAVLMREDRSQASDAMR